jgi:serine/threonine protein kinase
VSLFLPSSIQDDFTILEVLHLQEKSEMYLALQNSLQRKVLLKVFLKSSEDEKEKKRFLREARFLATLENPHILHIYHVEELKDYCFLTMEYLKGNSFLEIFKEKGAFAENDLWIFTLDICKALQTLSDEGIVHRNIKPSNLFLTSKNFVKISDLGFSKKIDEDSDLTKTGMILGTPEYISPEQVSGGITDHRSDIYSLGATLYHLLTGTPLFSGKTFVDILIKHHSDSPLPPQFYKPSLKEETSLILAKMIHKDPEQRYQNYKDIIEDIQCALTDRPLKTAFSPEGLHVYKFRPQITPPSQKFEETLHLWLKDSAEFSKTLKNLPFELQRASLQEHLENQKTFEHTLHFIKSITKVLPKDFELLQKVSPYAEEWSSELTSSFCNLLFDQPFKYKEEQKLIQACFKALFHFQNEESFWKDYAIPAFFCLYGSIKTEFVLKTLNQIQEIFLKKSIRNFGNEGLSLSLAFNRILNSIVGTTFALYLIILDKENSKN